MNPFSIGQLVDVEPDGAYTFEEFRGRIVDFEETTGIYTIKDQDNKHFDCESWQLSLPPEGE